MDKPAAVEPAAEPMGAPRTSPAEHVQTFGPYALIMIVWGVVAWDKQLSPDALRMADELFSAMLLLVNPAKQFVHSRAKKKDKPK